MNKCRICSNMIPNRQFIENKWRVLKSRKYCLKCSPFGRHNTKKLDNPYVTMEGYRTCPDCQKNLPITSFYKIKHKKGINTYCIECAKKRVMSQQKAIKKEALVYKGNVCKICGYSECDSAMEFHHRNKSEKDFNISYFKSKKIDDEIRRELDKCILLCCRCHREVEAGLIDCPE